MEDDDDLYRLASGSQYPVLQATRITGIVREELQEDEDEEEDERMGGIDPRQ